MIIEIKNYLKSKAWVIDELRKGNNIYYCGNKGHTKVTFRFLDKDFNTINDMEGFVNAVEIGGITEAKGTIISREEEIINDLLCMSDKFRTGILIPGVEQVNLNKYIKKDNFIICMKDIDTKRGYMHYDKSKEYGCLNRKWNLKEWGNLSNFVNSFYEAGNLDDGREVDEIYAEIIKKSIFSGKDLLFINNYLDCVRKHYENENEEYGDIHSEEMGVIDNILKMLKRFT